MFKIYIEFISFRGICCGGILTLQKTRFGGPGKPSFWSVLGLWFFTFFPRASERRVLPIVGVCISSSHLHTFSHTFSSSHLLVFKPSHLHICSSSHLLIFTSAHLTSSHLHIFTYSHLHFLSLALTSSHTHIFSLSPLSSLLSLSLFSLSPSLSFSL